ncbi:uncharacterized protein N7479_008463 [Penicillium vulpinum]|uniref:Uncharacterized protein n=1 Tax=Penicillium vulpinum TaxID=29845 RepID=A0A1V6RN71_9EURO|nr:uncharacterized protein N7479_008463 [Penicillium vulpinum]KAJ5961313.1 hypothetical protein N7479_008463 [Penicillium vulpinum]OQE02884.1 hypothetical protein PENVUL_c037G08441 [Penicillium vulpinum]
MCGKTNRPTYGGTIAVLFPRGTDQSSTISHSSLSSPPESVSSFASSSSTASMSSYSLFFRDTDATTSKTKAILRKKDTETYHVLGMSRNVDIRIEKYGDLSTTTQPISPLYQFHLNSERDKNSNTTNLAEIEFELPERLDLGVSEKGIIGRQVTVREQGGSILWIGVVGYN